MKLILVFFALSSMSLPAFAQGFCGDTAKNTVIMTFVNPNQYSVSFSGTNPDTAASEILGYMKKAGAAGGVKVAPTTLFGTTKIMSYTAGNIGASELVSGNLCPPLQVGVTKTTNTWPLWSLTLSQSVVRVIPSNDDALTLANLMKAAGVTPLPDHSLGPDGVIYKGSSVVCNLDTINGTPSASCVITANPAN